jgi:hypothetical protein
MSTCSNRTKPLRFHILERMLIRTKAEAGDCIRQWDTAVFPPVDDTYFSNAGVDTVNGAKTVLQVGRTPSQGKGGSPLLLRTQLHFDLTPFPNAPVFEANLWLFATSGQGLPTLSIARLTNSFSESTATWNSEFTNAPASPPPPITQQVSSSEGWKVFDVTPLVQDCLANRGDQCYWRLSEVNETDNSTASLLNLLAEEFGGDTTPQLKITYVP